MLFRSVEQTSYEHEDREAVESVYDMGRKSFIEIAETILRQIQPYTVKKTISLLSDSMDDPDMAPVHALEDVDKARVLHPAASELKFIEADEYVLRSEEGPGLVVNGRAGEPVERFTG